MTVDLAADDLAADASWLTFSEFSSPLPLSPPQAARLTIDPIKANLYIYVQNVLIVFLLNLKDYLTECKNFVKIRLFLGKYSHLLYFRDDKSYLFLSSRI
jgi:hypothetical protein